MNFHRASGVKTCYNPFEKAINKGADKTALMSRLVCAFGVRLQQSKEDSKDKESIQSGTTPVPGYQMGKYKFTINITNKSQEVSPFPSGDHKAAMNRRESMTSTTHK